MTGIVTFVRASSLVRAAECPRMWGAKNLRREVEALGHRLRRLPYSVAATVGLATHRAGEVILREKAQSGSPPTVDVGTDAARDYLVESLSQGETAYDTVTANRTVALRQVIAMSRLYYHKVAPNIQPTLVEHRLEADFNGIVVSGQADVVAVEPGQIDDLKTGTRNPGNFNAQIGCYSLLARSAGIEIEQGAIDFIKRVPVGKVQPDPIRITVPLAIAEQTAINTIRHIVDDLRVFREGDDRLGLKAGDPAAFLANPNSILCSEKYCPAHGTSFCQEWQRSEAG